MDILIHTLSGMAVGTVVSGLSKGTGIKKALIVFTGMVAGALPDLDVISLWSGFDETIGSWLNLNHEGRDIYFGKYWYSHHAITHSVFAALVCSGTLLGLMKLVKRKQFRRKDLVFGITFFGGYMAHLFGDLPTPASAWDGIQLWFPSSEWVGGFGQTWWWNNYDIFLLLLITVLLNTGCNLANRWVGKNWIRWIPLAAVVLCSSLCVYQLKTRGQSFNYVRYEDSKFKNLSQKSLDIQKEILGDTIFEWMCKFDKSLPVQF